MKTIDDYKKEFLSLAKQMCRDFGTKSVSNIYIRDANCEYEKCIIEF